MRTVHRESQCGSFFFSFSPFPPRSADCSFFCCCCGAPTADRRDVAHSSLSEGTGLQRLGQSHRALRAVTNPRDSSLPPSSSLPLQRAWLGKARRVWEGQQDYIWAFSLKNTHLLHKQPNIRVELQGFLFSKYPRAPQHAGGRHTDGQFAWESHKILHKWRISEHLWSELTLTFIHSHSAWRRTAAEEEVLMYWSTRSSTALQDSKSHSSKSTKALSTKYVSKEKYTHAEAEQLIYYHVQCWKK